jgi:hypothetical protein
MVTIRRRCYGGCQDRGGGVNRIQEITVGDVRNAVCATAGVKWRSEKTRWIPCQKRTGDTARELLGGTNGVKTDSQF